MKGMIVRYKVDGVEYQGPVLDVLHVPMQVASRSGLVGPSAESQTGFGIVSTVFVPVLDKPDTRGLPEREPLEYNFSGKVRAIPLSDVVVTGSVWVDGAGPVKIVC